MSDSCFSRERLLINRVFFIGSLGVDGPFRVEWLNSVVFSKTWPVGDMGLSSDVRLVGDVDMKHEGLLANGASSKTMLDIWVLAGSDVFSDERPLKIDALSINTFSTVGSLDIEDFSAEAFLSVSCFSRVKLLTNLVFFVESLGDGGSFRVEWLNNVVFSNTWPVGDRASSDEGEIDKALSSDVRLVGDVEMKHEGLLANEASFKTLLDVKVLAGCDVLSDERPLEIGALSTNTFSTVGPLDIEDFSAEAFLNDSCFSRERLLSNRVFFVESLGDGASFRVEWLNNVFSNTWPVGDGALSDEGLLGKGCSS